MTGTPITTLFTKAIIGNWPRSSGQSKRLHRERPQSHRSRRLDGLAAFITDSEVAQTVRKIVAPVPSVLIAIDLHHVIRLILVMAHFGHTLNQPLAIPCHI